MSKQHSASKKKKYQISLRSLWQLQHKLLIIVRTYLKLHKSFFSILCSAVADTKYFSTAAEMYENKQVHFISTRTILK